MPRRRRKIKSVDKIKTLDSSRVRRLCSSSLPERLSREFCLLYSLSSVLENAAVLEFDRE